MRSQRRSSISMREKSLSSEAITLQGPCSVEVRSIMSFTARSYWGHFLRLRQSSSVILKRLKLMCSRALKRLYCSALPIASQADFLAAVDDLVVGSDGDHDTLLLQ